MPPDPKDQRRDHKGALPAQSHATPPEPQTSLPPPTQHPALSTQNSLSVAVIIIGRNESSHLPACIHSALPHTPHIIYVDSGSSDNSVPLAQQLSATILQLDPTQPFTAARARNAGANLLLQAHPHIPYLQFVDGDCEFSPPWVPTAAAYLSAHPDVAVVAGRRRERYPNKNIYHQLTDMEWNTPPGPAKEFGGDALIRTSAFLELHGYRDSLIAGEEPDLAIRLRQAGWRITRLDHDMTIHDINMSKFSQWWTRTLRSGHAMAQRAHLHAAAPNHPGQRDCLSVLLWTLPLPLLTLALAPLIHFYALLFLTPYAILTSRITRHRLARQDLFKPALIYALFCILGKFPQLLGLATFYLNHYRHRPTPLIEYHQPTPIIPPPSPIGTSNG